MDKKAVGLAGALAISCLTLTEAQASSLTQSQSRASAYAALLKPIPNAAETLKVADAAVPAQASPSSEAAAPDANDISDPLQWHRRHHRRHHHHHHHHHWHG